MFENGGRKKPDVLLLDIQLETYDSGIKLIEPIKSISPKLKIIMLTVHKESDLVFNAFTLGACAYHLKSDSIQSIVTTIRNSYDSSIALQTGIADIFMEKCRDIMSENHSLLYTLDTISKLTNSELQILFDLNNNLSYTDIAHKRFVEANTVRSQVSRLLKKFNLKNASELQAMIKNLKLDKLLKKS